MGDMRSMVWRCKLSLLSKDSLRRSSLVMVLAVIANSMSISSRKENLGSQTLSLCFPLHLSLNQDVLLGSKSTVNIRETRTKDGIWRILTHHQPKFSRLSILRRNILMVIFPKSFLEVRVKELSWVSTSNSWRSIMLLVELYSLPAIQFLLLDTWSIWPLKKPELRQDTSVKTWDSSFGTVIRTLFSQSKKRWINTINSLPNLGSPTPSSQSISRKDLVMIQASKALPRCASLLTASPKIYNLSCEILMNNLPFS